MGKRQVVFQHNQRLLEQWGWDKLEFQRRSCDSTIEGWESLPKFLVLIGALSGLRLRSRWKTPLTERKQQAFGFTPYLNLYLKVKVKVTQSCWILCDPLDYTVHGILQTRILEWVAFPFSRGCLQPRDQAQVSSISGRFTTSWATKEAQMCLLIHNLTMCTLQGKSFSTDLTDSIDLTWVA